MILLTPTHINLGLRPSGLYESVSRSDLSVQLTKDSIGGEPYLPPFTLTKFKSFKERPLSDLQTLRALRPTMLLKVKKERKTKEKTHVTASVSPRKRTSKSSALITSRLSTLDPVTAALIKKLTGVG